MRQIKKVDKNITTLNQTSTKFNYGLIYPGEEVKYYGGVRCKDYFNEMFAYIHFGKYKNEKVFGFNVKGEYFDEVKGQDKYEFFLQTASFPEDYLNKFNNLKELFVINNLEEIISGVSLEQCEGGYIISFDSELTKYGFVISYFLEKVREHAGVTTSYRNSMPNEEYEVKMFQLMWDKKDKYRLDKYNGIGTSHNTSGFVSTMSSLDIKKVLVYGTLRKGFGNHRLLKDSIFLAEKRVNIRKYENGKYMQAKLYNLGGFPGIKFNEPISPNKEDLIKITVEEYAVDNETFEKLDRLEGYSKENPTGGLYNRFNYLGSWIYEYNGQVNEDNLIKNGDYASIFQTKS